MDVDCLLIILPDTKKFSSIGYRTNSLLERRSVEKKKHITEWFQSRLQTVAPILLDLRKNNNKKKYKNKKIKIKINKL
jgi:hypothetical protein